MLAEAAPAGRSQKSERLDEEALREMMLKYQAADATAAEDLVRSLSPLLYRFLSQTDLATSDTEDLLQECWLRIHRSRHTYRPSEPVLPWIFAIARHTRLDGYRRRRRLQSREIVFDALPENLQARNRRLDGQDHDFERLLGALPESQREVLLMMKVSGMRLDEVARATSTSVGAVKQKVHRAYEKLRRLLSEEGGPPVKGTKR
jgi:RNA polymerase sigma-70 factor (ECF subfamily)